MSIAGASFGDGATTHFDGNLMIGGILIQGGGTPSAIATAGPVTYTPAQLLSGLILRDPAGASRSDVTPSATALANAVPGAAAGTAFEFAIRNDAGGAFTITVTAGLGATLSGTMTIAQSTMRTFRVVFTSASAYTLYSLGSVTF